MIWYAYANNRIWEWQEIKTEMLMCELGTGNTEIRIDSKAFLV